MKGLKEITQHLHLIDMDAVVEKGRLCFRMGIEKHNNPEKAPLLRELWEMGWKLESDKFYSSQKRERYDRG